MVTNYLIELLKDNECVIVPEFGAFISKRHSATIDYANHRFIPPYKEVVFNNKLTNNDNILVDFISKKRNITRDESMKFIHDFVNKSAAILDVNSELELEGLGKLRRFGDDCVLSVNENVNILGDSFGLTDFSIQPIFRTETYQIIKEQIVVEQKAKNTEYSLAVESVEDNSQVASRRKPYLLKAFSYTIIVFLIFFAINWTTDNSESNLASWNPFLYSSPNEFLIRNMECSKEKKVEVVEIFDLQDDKIEEELFVVESEDLETVESSVAEELENIEVVGLQGDEVQDELDVLESENLNITETENIKDMVTSNYFIIGGSFQTVESAEKCLGDLKKQGFENASLLEKNDKGYIRVSYESFAEKADALVRLEVIKNDYNKSAWLLFQK